MSSPAEIPVPEGSPTETVYEVGNVAAEGGDLDGVIGELGCG